MPALVAGMYALSAMQSQGVDGRDEPGHDEVDGLRVYNQIPTVGQELRYHIPPLRSRRIGGAPPRALAKGLFAFAAGDGAAADHFFHEIIGNGRDLALRQRCAGRQGRGVAAEIAPGDAVAAPVGIRLLIEMRHRLAGHAAGDHLDQLRAGERRGPQTGRARRLRLAGTVPRPAVAIQALRFVEKKPTAEGEVVAARRR
jgi:hypothetical protein